MPRERKPLIAPGSVLTPSAPEGGGDVMSRIIARDRERRVAAEDESPTPSAPTFPVPPPPPEPDPPATLVKEDNIDSNKVGNISSNTEESITENKQKNITRNKKPSAVDGDTGSIADQIRQSLLQSAAPAPLKVITLKLPPDLDQKIEEHCGRYNRKKQDVLRDAVLLYFETLEKM